MTKVIAVHSFKGGTGKTTLTANLAATLALHHRVGVMDLDLSGPGLHVSLFQDTLQKVGEQCNLDYIIVDTHPGVENDTVLAMGCCDVLVLVSRVDQQDLFGTAVMVLLAETFEKPTFLTLNMVPPGVRIKDAVKVGRELATLFKSRFLQAFEFQMDVINNLSRSVFVVDNPDSGFAHKINEAAEMLINELAEVTQPAN